MDPDMTLSAASADVLVSEQDDAREADKVVERALAEEGVGIEEPEGADGEDVEGAEAGEGFGTIDDPDEPDEPDEPDDPGDPGDSDGIEITTSTEGHIFGRGSRGQSTVEYAVVLLAFLAIVVAFAALWHAGRDGLLIRRATQAASHLFGGGDALGSAKDILLF
jgi:hypothetical protein